MPVDPEVRVGPLLGAIDDAALGRVEEDRPLLPGRVQGQGEHVMVPTGFTPGRKQDRTFVGTIMQAMAAYGAGRFGTPEIPLSDVAHMIVIGSDRMMAAVGAARHGVLKPYLRPVHTAIGSINSPMQCMMKEVCAQRLQPHIDPVTGARSVVFSCFNQD